MTDTVLYEENPRPYEPPPQMVDQTHVQQKSINVQDQLRREVVEMFAMLQLVLDPLAKQMHHVRRQANVKDLVRKLKWYTVLFDQIIGTNIFTALEKETFEAFKGQVNALLRRRCIDNEDFDPSSGKMPVIPIADLLMAVCFDACPWTTLEDFYQQLANHPLSHWSNARMWGISHSLHARVIRIATKELLFLGSTKVRIICYHWSRTTGLTSLQEKFPKNKRTFFFWQPLKEWCHRHRTARLLPDEQAACGTAFRAYEAALQHAKVNPEVIGGKRSELSPTDLEGFRQVIRQSPMAVLALPAANDVGFAMDIKGIKVKDACARCLAQRFGGSRMLGQ
ncbi:MAG: hypothetical protein Q9184_006237, partial [Pyrenodesmia sp. 2 TL-2023]